MAKSKKKKNAVDGITQQLAALTINSPTPPEPHHEVCVTTQWETYIQKGNLEDFQRLCVDLGLPSDLGSKKKCRNVCWYERDTTVMGLTSSQEIKSLNVNIKQFLGSKNKPEDVEFFESRRALIKYTRKTSSFFPRGKLPKGDPLRALLKVMG